MSKKLFNDLKTLSSGKKRHLTKGTFLFHQRGSVESLFLVLTGEIHLVRPQLNGNCIVLQRARQNNILAEASLYSCTYHCHAVAEQETQVCVLPKQEVLARLQSDSELAYNWMTYLAQEVQQSRFRSELLSLKTVAMRLDAWLNWNDGGLPPKGEWKILAEQLAVSPEALYRELARR